MNVGRLWRTVRHLSPQQIAYAGIRRLRHERRRRQPDAARHSLMQSAQALPIPDPGASVLERIAGGVEALQAAVHNDVDGIPAGRFDFLGRSVDFGALEAVDWRRRLDEESSPLWRLTLAYFGWAVILIGKDPAYLPRIAAAVAALEQAGDWTTPGIFRDLWNPYTASHRLINLLVTLSRYRAQGGKAGTPDEVAILDHVRFCAAHIAADLERDLQFNHLLKNYVALAVFAAAALSVPASFGWLESAVPRALRQIVLPDGGHAERSPMYQVLGLLDLRLLRETGLFPDTWTPELERRIPAMERTLACLTHPDGEIALFGDSWLGGAPPSSALDLPASAPGVSTLPLTGYARLDGGDDCVIFDCGLLGAPQNPAHGHADYLSIEASIAGKRFIVDFGTPTYVTGALRDLSRSAAVHNGPRLAGLEPAELWKSFRVGRRGRAGLLEASELALAPLWSAGWQDGYGDKGLELRRWVGLWPGQGFVVADLWRGPLAVSSPLSEFLIADSWQPQAGPGIAFAGPVRLEIEALAGHVEGLGTKTWWPRYGESSGATGLRLVPDGSGFAAIGFLRSTRAKPALGVIGAIRAALERAPASTAATV